jgi:hypothetical protein
MIQLETTDEFMAQYADVQTATAWRLESSLREFSNFKPVNFWFEYPLHRVDDKGILAKHYADGDPKANLDKSGKRTQTPESRKDEFDAAFDICLADNEFCTTDELANYLGISVRTVQKRVSEFENDYLLSKGNIYRK